MTGEIDTLVSAEWLNDHLDDPRVRVLDIRGYVRSIDLGGGRQQSSYDAARDEFEASHVPGAQYVDWTMDIVDPDADVKAQIAPPERFEQAMSERGVGDASFVVVVDHTGGHHATRLWWALRYYGHDEVAVLDGGFKRWQALGLPVQSGAADAVEPATFTPRTRSGLISDVNDVQYLVEKGGRQLVDARDGATFNGEVQRASRGGHIPTAINFPTSGLYAEDGTWKSPDAIREAARSVGVDPDQPVTAYCNGGVTATAVLFGLHRAGLADISNYDGSWNEWGEREDLPVEGNRDLWKQGEGAQRISDV